MLQHLLNPLFFYCHEFSWTLLTNFQLLAMILVMLILMTIITLNIINVPPWSRLRSWLSPMILPMWPTLTRTWIRVHHKCYFKLFTGFLTFYISNRIGLIYFNVSLPTSSVVKSVIKRKEWSSFLILVSMIDNWVVNLLKTFIWSLMPIASSMHSWYNYLFKHNQFVNFFDI